MKYYINNTSKALIALLIAVGLVGCATVNPKPFQQYEEAVREAQSGIDAAMSANYDWTRTGFSEEFAINTNSAFSQLLIQQSEGYAWTIGADPVYLKIKEARAALAELNGAFADYVGLLSTLAGGDLVSTDKFDELAGELNENTRSAAEALSLEMPSEGFSLFSTAASEAARLYIEKRRQKHLKRVLETNQDNVQAYADTCVSLVHAIRGTMKTYYSSRMEPIKVSWNAAKPDKRLKPTEDALKLNEQFADSMRALQELETAYETLPKAHEDLSKAIEKPEFSLNGIKTLYASGKRLQKLYGQLENATEK